MGKLKGCLTGGGIAAMQLCAALILFIAVPPPVAKALDGYPPGGISPQSAYTMWEASNAVGERWKAYGGSFWRGKNVDCKGFPIGDADSMLSLYRTYGPNMDSFEDIQGVCREDSWARTHANTSWQECRNWAAAGLTFIPQFESVSEGVEVEWLNIIAIAIALLGVILTVLYGEWSQDDYQAWKSQYILQWQDDVCGTSIDGL